MYAIKKFFNGIHTFMVYLAIIQLLAMTIIVSLQVFCRYFLGFSLRWADEVALILVIWFSFISLAIGVKNRLHISIELFTMKLPEKILKNYIMRLTYLCTLIAGIVMIYYGILLVQNGMMSTLPGTGFTSSVEYIFVPVSGVLVVYDSIMDLLGLDKCDSHLEQEFLGGNTEHA